ncbi:ribonuclease HI [Bathymodiolus septemdierum thioautotrophic gill symbiont]|uniref:Ribonuclease H n=1 Tax=endosymbiont of Bathymodiolus septemdierum str. Myojin knoll TaxID=1303921 RepID=A0A0P0US78_9GAMM|nr:ribonuclease HI [Bathymodiolus septemdierum thioautotrophic gill symbiont]BAS68004.1 ribonuclease HI [endosymbiont of Bathymodiolus septemdierum str. Myojin knoll]
MNKILIYTDGGCRGNPGVGGWGVWLRYKGAEKKLKGAEKDTTNNRMELTAAIKALEALKSDEIEVDLYTDSKYVMNGINDWIVNWKKKNWKTAGKRLVKNVDLWQKLDTLNAKYSVNWHWVKGHSDDKGNDMADLLANQAMNEFH